MQVPMQVPMEQDRPDLDTLTAVIAHSQIVVAAAVARLPAGFDASTSPFSIGSQPKAAAPGTAWRGCDLGASPLWRIAVRQRGEERDDVIDLVAASGPADRRACRRTAAPY